MFIFAACDFNYWWSRGQTKSPSQLFQHATGKLNAAKESFGSSRPEIQAIANSLHSQFSQLLESSHTTEKSGEAVKIYSILVNDFIDLESKLSIGSRAAYGELAGQLRSFQKRAESGEPVDAGALELFVARTLSFLASEMSVPAPAV